MKKSILTKLLTGYLLFGLIAFVFVAVFSQNLTYNFLVKSSSEKLYSEAQLLSDTFEDEKYLTSNIREASDEIFYVAEFLDSRIWIVSSEGKILIDSDGGILNGGIIQGFDPALSGDSYTIGHFFNMFSDEMMTVEAPINYNYSTAGYVIIHYPMSDVLGSTDSVLNVVYITSLAVYLLSGILLFIIIPYVLVPLKKLTAACDHYAAGDFSHKTGISANEGEISKIAGTMDYLSERIEFSDKYQRDFISNVSHDFRSPLTSIKGYLEAILDGTIPYEMQEKYIRRVISETERLSKLTESMIQLRTSDDSKYQLNRENFDINKTIRDVCSSNENACMKKNIVFDLEFVDESDFVYADFGKIQQVLYNLIDNAIKFSENNSVIYIKTDVRLKKIFITIKDTGIGIPKSSINKIWDRFYKSDLSRGKDKTGTGLGLAIVKEIINAHHETIDVISTPSVGTEFIFSLPLSEQ